MAVLLLRSAHTPLTHICATAVVAACVHTLMYHFKRKTWYVSGAIQAARQLSQKLSRMLPQMLPQMSSFGYVLHNVDANLVQNCNNFGAYLGIFWCRFGYILVQIWAYFRADLGIFSCRFSCRFVQPIPYKNRRFYMSAHHFGP